MGVTLTQDLIIYLLGLAALSGIVWAKVNALERKVEKHNNMIDRTYKLEERVNQHDSWLSDLEHKIMKALIQ